MKKKKKITRTQIKKNQDFRDLAKEFVRKAAGILDTRFVPNAISLRVGNFHSISLQAMMIFTKTVTLFEFLRVKFCSFFSVHEKPILSILCQLRKKKMVKNLLNKWYLTKKEF